MPLDIAKIRGDTPGVAMVTHFNAAGSSLPPQVVVDAVIGHIEREATIGGYEAADEAAERVDAVYHSVASLIGAQPNEIAIIENATRAWDMAVYGFPFQAGDRVLIGRSEYASNLIALLQLQRRCGIEIVVIDDDPQGQISLDMLARELASGAAMVAMTHVPTSGGLVNPAEAVGALCRDAGACFVLDACQSAGQLPLDVDAIGCDVLSATGRKYLRGPRGTGFLYVSSQWLSQIEPPMLDLHAATLTSDTTYEIRADARRFENWETNYAGKLGLGAAIDYANRLGVPATWDRVQLLGNELRRSLSTVPGVHVHDKGEVKGGIVTFTVDGSPATEVRNQLAEQSIFTSVSSGAAARLDLGARNLEAVVRASVHYYNTNDEIDLLAAALHRSSAG